MKISFEEPTKESLVMRVTFNGEEVIRQEFAAGTTPSIDYKQPPNTSGVAQVYVLVGDQEIPFGSATYWAPDFIGAQMLVQQAEKLLGSKKPWQARTKLMEAVGLFEKFAPDSDDVAKAYMSLCFICIAAKARKYKLAQRKLEAIAWYEKAIGVWDRTSNVLELGNLINLSVMYALYGDPLIGLNRAERGLAIARFRDEKNNPETIAAWTQTAWQMISLGLIDEAEKVIDDGLKRFPDNPNRALLWNLKSQVYTARSAFCQKVAEDLLASATQGKAG